MHLLYIVNFRIKTAIAQGGMIKVLYKEAQEGGLFHPVWQVWKYIFLCMIPLWQNFEKKYFRPSSGDAQVWQ